jgi:hypothetical protein
MAEHKLPKEYNDELTQIVGKISEILCICITLVGTDW